MELLVAYRDDPAGYNMARYLTQNLENENGIFHGENFDLIVISTPTISADWIEEKYQYDGFIFLSKHAAESGKLALTCHSTGNFNTANFGGNPKQVAIPHPNFQKTYMKNLSENHELFPEKTNVEVVEIINRKTIKMMVWERGAGITLACGSGACAAVYACVLKEYTDNKVEVQLEKGSLEITIQNNEAIMLGPAEVSYKGYINI